MSEMSRPAETTIPPRLSTLISLDRAAGFDPGKLTVDEAEILLGIVSRTVTPAQPFDMAMAIAALGRAGQSEQVVKVLSRILGDEAEPTVRRTAAAIALRTVADPRARRALLEAVRVTEPRIRLQVLRSLGAVGDAAALDELEGLPPPSRVAERKQLVLAKALISHRLGRPQRHLPDSRGVPRQPGAVEEMVALTLRLEAAQAIRFALSRLVGATYDVTIGDRGFDLRAGKAWWTVFVNAEIGGAALDRLFDRAWIAALLARWHEPTQTAAVQYLALTTPRERSVLVDVVRTDGEVAYTGQLTRAEGSTRFSMRDVAREGTAPTNVEGRLAPDGVALDLVIPFGRRENTKTGVAMPAPPLS